MNKSCDILTSRQLPALLMVQLIKLHDQVVDLYESYSQINLK